MHKFIKKGDTLIEVLIAFAIFSAIAMSVIGVSMANVNRIQTSLEDTVAQTEIDSQVEALRFIQESYQTDPSDPFYSALWRRILELSNNVNGADGNAGTEDDLDISKVQEDFTSIDAPYDKNPDSKSSIYNFNAFIINTRLLNHMSGLLFNALLDEYVSRIIIPASPDNGIFSTAQIAPRLLYSDEDGNILDQQELISNPEVYSDMTSLARAEGIWIIAVTDDKGNFVDFYIRTCWDGPGASTPDKISTTIRLADPAKIAYADPIAHNSIKVIFHYKEGGVLKEKEVYADGVAKVGGQVSVSLEGLFPSLNYNPNLNAFLGWQEGTEHPADPDNWLGSIKKDYYCEKGDEVGRCKTGGSKTAYEMIFDTETYNETTTIHLYSIIKPKMVLLFLIDISGSMQDDINNHKDMLGNLANTIENSNGAALVYTIGGIPQYDIYNPDRYPTKPPYTTSLRALGATDSTKNVGPVNIKNKYAGSDPPSNDNGRYELRYDSSVRNWVENDGTDYCKNNLDTTKFTMQGSQLGLGLNDLTDQVIGVDGGFANIGFIGMGSYVNERGQHKFNDRTPETCSLYYINYLADTVLSSSTYNGYKKAIVYLTDTNGRNTNQGSLHPSLGQDSITMSTLFTNLRNKGINFYTITDGDNDWDCNSIADTYHSETKTYTWTCNEPKNKDQGAYKFDDINNSTKFDYDLNGNLIEEGA